ncbi:MAG: alpha/beta hydrolase, partial [Nitrospira sp.]|nr:alpha/beta hydrolase [Nitrospira sp.]
LPHLSLPKLFVHGDRDDIIPIELGQRAFAAAKAPKEFYIVRGADHNDVPSVGGRAYFATLSAFIAAALGR